MKRSWTQGLDEQQAQEMRIDFVGSSLTRERLTEMLQDKIIKMGRYGNSAERYCEANWEQQQADVNGYTRALLDVISLIKSESQEE